MIHLWVEEQEYTNCVLSWRRDSFYITSHHLAIQYFQKIYEKAFQMSAA